jgi:hypothetical protein
MTANGHLGKQFDPLPMEEGLYYRSHPRGVPFGREHATTKPIGEPPHPDLAKYWEPKEGYSAFWNPHHVEQYHEEMGWSMKGRNIVAFRGRAVGEGSDGEPRVVPTEDKPVMRLSPKQFGERLARTDNGYGRWHEHTWGDGPRGRQVDDGYRTLGEMT